MALLLDTGAVYAGADEEDAWHGRMQAFLQSAREKILLPSTVVTKSCFVLRARLGPRAEQAFLMSVAQGEAELVPFEPEDAQRTAELLRQYETARLDFVDASVVAIAERLGITKVATTDRRDFSIVRPKHCERLEFVP